MKIVTTTDLGRVIYKIRMFWENEDTTLEVVYLNKVERFVYSLKEFQSSSGVFNPWYDVDSKYDMDDESPQKRTAHLEAYLQSRVKRVKYILIAEALGYQGGHFSGIAMTSERILLDHHREIRVAHVFENSIPERTSRLDLPLTPKKIFKTTLSSGFNEPTATTVWSTILNASVNPYDVILWNAFPFHPYDSEIGYLSNRPPTSSELEIGEQYICDLIALCTGSPNLIAIGNKAKDILNAMGLTAEEVIHPSYGNTNEFKTALTSILQSNRPSN